MDKMREEFEMFAESRGFDPKYYFGRSIHPNHYDHDTVNEMWLSWQASRASLCVELPSKRYGWDICRNTFIDGSMCGFNDGVDESAKAISAVGVSYK